MFTYGYFFWHIFVKRLVQDLADLMTILVVHTASGVADVLDYAITVTSASMPTFGYDC